MRNIPPTLKSPIFLVGWVFTVSFLYLVWIGLPFHFHWNTSFGDSADYVYLAEHFWGVPHRARFYEPLYYHPWGDFLDLFPFRQIGVGTYYLAMSRVFGDRVGIWGRYVLDGLLAASYSWFALQMLRKLGLVFSLVSSALLILTTVVATSGDVLLTEPFLRILFVLLFGILMTLEERWSRSFFRTTSLLTVILLATVNFKIQWLLLWFVLFLSLNLEFFRKWTVQKRAYFIAVFFLVPLSVSAVNRIGWSYPRMSAGESLHVMWKVGNRDDGRAFMAKVCKEPELQSLSPKFCNPPLHPEKSWGLFIGDQYPEQMPKVMKTLDRIAYRALPWGISAWLQTLRDGSRLMLNFRLLVRNPVLLGVFQGLFVLSILILAYGLFRKKPRLISIYCLTLVSVPLICFHFALWDPRYQMPMAGLPIIGAMIVVASTRNRRATHV